MLWQSAYTEFVIMNKLWPDFTKADLDEALRISAAATAATAVSD